jgi:1-phosphofructokinase family hexose kinase
MIVTLTLNPSLDEWIHLPTLRLGQLNRAVSFQRYPGGKGINVSRVLHELRRPTVAMGVIGGYDGQLLVRMLERIGIDHRFVTVTGVTRNNYQLKTDRPPAITQVNAPGPQVSARTLAQVRRALLDGHSRVEAYVLSGSLPPGAPTATYAQLLRALHRVGARTVLDSSGAALREGLAAAPWMAKPNREEAEELLGRRLRQRADAIEAAEHLADATASVVILSLGREGAVLAAREPRAVLWADPLPIRARSTVGAGDSLVAGFVSEWLRTRSWSKALAMGIACGAATAMTSGTELCHRADVVRLRPKVRITLLRGAR